MNVADLWLGRNAPNAQKGNTELRGFDTARLIAQRASTITITRLVDDHTVTLPPQTVRLEVVQSIRNANEQRDALLAVTKQYVVIIGYKDCPGIPDTDMQRGDQFYYAGLMFEVQEFLPTVPGRLLASGELTP